MGSTGEAIKAGFWTAFRFRQHEMPVRLYFLTWLPNLIFQTLFYSLVALFAGGPDLARFALVGSLVRMAALPTLVQTTSHLVADREEGYLSYLITTPVTLGVLLLGRSLFFAAEGALTVLLASAVVLPLAGVRVSPAGFLLFCVALGATCLSLAGLGLLVGSVVFRSRWDMVAASLVVQALAIFCGVVVPVSVFPGWVQGLVAGVPLTNGLAAARSFLEGQGWQAVPLVGVELAVGVLYWLCGLLVLMGSVQVGRSKGNLERF